MQKILEKFKNYINNEILGVNVLLSIRLNLLFLPKLVRNIIEVLSVIICLPIMSILKKKTKKKLYDFVLKKKNLKFSCEGKEVIFSLPNLLDEDGSSDFIQKAIFCTKSFFSYYELKRIKNQYIKKDSIILDIGSNIGNHVVYWGKICNAKKIYCFEPIQSTFAVLEENIKLNNLENKTIRFNCAVGKTDGFASVAHFNKNNTGGTKVIESENGDIKVISIDNIESIDNVDFIKIDVEGFECNVLQGCVETIKKYKPVVFIESFPVNFAKVDSFFHDISYVLFEKIDDINFIYKSLEDK